MNIRIVEETDKYADTEIYILFGNKDIHMNFSDLETLKESIIKFENEHENNL